MIRPLVMPLAWLIVFAGALEAQTTQKAENFDSDPKWEGKSNWVQVKPVRVVQDFGFSQTQHAGGKAAGEMGGRIWRSTTPAFYGKVLPKPMTMNDPLHCSGKFVVTQSMGTSSFYFGWFNSETMAARPRNYLGLMLNGEKNGTEVYVGFNTNENQSDGGRATGVGPRGAAVRDFNRIPDGTIYTWDLIYDPKANDGNGRITFSLGGDGPHTVKNFIHNVHPDQRRAGGMFNRFGMVNAQSPPGNPMVIYFDDITIDGETESFDKDPGWPGTGNRASFDDDNLAGTHRYGFSTTDHAGGKSVGELGGVIYSSPGNPGYYGGDVGKLTLDDRLVASGKLTQTACGPEAGLYIGWFNSEHRGFPPRNLLGVLLEGPVSSGAQFRPNYATVDPKIGEAVKHAPVVRSDGRSYSWKIEYDPQAEAGRGQITVWLDDEKSVLVLDPAARKQSATFDRFGIAIYEGGGQFSRTYLDDLEYTTAKPPKPR